MELLDDETLEDLQINSLKILQKKNGFRFGIDAVLLSDFAKDIASNCTLDLCTGSGIIPILLSAKTETAKFCGLEIQKPVCDMAKRSVILNNLTDRIFIDSGDLKNAVQIYGKRVFDLITCNPPYMPIGCGIKNPDDAKIIARHELLCTLEDVISVSGKLLKHHGRLLLVHKPSRLADIVCLMRENDIEPKRIRFIHKLPSSEPSLVLVDGSFKGGRELRILPPLYLYNEDGTETKELTEVYKK